MYRSQQYIAESAAIKKATPALKKAAVWLTIPVLDAIKSRSPIRANMKADKKRHH
jgi:hypothetical protein